MADLDSELGQRLGRLAAAVPESSGQLDAVHREAVRARQTVRMAWLTPLVVIVAGLVVATALNVGPFAPGASPRPSESGTAAGPIRATTSDGDFTLSIEATKGIWVEGEPIDISASFGYEGKNDHIVISHGTGGRPSPVLFGIDEPIFGGAHLEPGWDRSCTATTILRDRPTDVPFEKTPSALFDPATSDIALFLVDPELHLPPGVWHVYAQAVFQPFDCLDIYQPPEPNDMRVVLQITVLPRPTETPRPSDGNPSEPTTAPPGASAVDQDGDLTLELRADRQRYGPGDAIEVVGTLLFTGPPGTIDLKHGDSGPIVFGIRERVFGEIEVGEISMLMFDHTTLVTGMPHAEPFTKGGGFSGEHPDAPMFRAWLENPILSLPEGTWHLYASATGTRDVGGSEVGPYELSAEIEIVVDDDPGATPGHPAPTEWNDGPVYGGDDMGWAALQLKSEHPRYELGKPVEISAWYWFMDGDPALVASHFEPELGLSIEQLDATDPRTRTVVDDSACTDLGLVEGQERHVSLGPHNVVSFRADAVPGSFENLFGEGALYLPVGRWRITATVAGTFAPCGEQGDAYGMTATIEIQVVQHLE